MTKYRDTRDIDGLTTAERSINNARELKKLETILQQLVDVVEPANVQFGDGSNPITQATRAEDITSVKDIDLQAQVDTKASQAQVDTIQTQQDTNTSNIATNTSNIASNESRITANETNIATNTSNIASNESRITANETQIATNLGKNQQQDQQIQSLQLALAGSQEYLAHYSANGTVDGTPKRVEFIVDLDYDDTEAIENIETTPNFTNGWTIKKAQKFSFAFTLIAQQLSGTTPTQTVKLVDELTGDVLASTSIKYDFSGTTDIESGYQKLTYLFTGTNYTLPRNVYIETSLDAGSILIDESSGVQESTVQRETLTTVRDIDIQSTNDLGNANAQQDFNELNQRTIDNQASITNKIDGSYESGTSGVDKIIMNQFYSNNDYTFVVETERPDRIGVKMRLRYDFFGTGGLGTEIGRILYEEYDPITSEWKAKPIGNGGAEIVHQEYVKGQINQALGISKIKGVK